MQRKIRILSAVLCIAMLFSAGLALPAEKAKVPPKVPTVTGDTEVAEHKLVRLNVENCDSAVWFIEPAEVVDIDTKADGKGVTWTAPPGVYTVHTVTLTAGKLGQLRSKVTIKGDDDSVNPPDPRPDPKPEPGDNPWRPSSAWKSQCSPILSLRLSRSDADSLSNLYGNLSKPASLANLATTGDLRQRLAQEGSSLGLKGKYAGLAEAVDAYLAVSVRLDNVPLNREAAGPILETLAWAIWETGRGQ